MDAYLTECWTELSWRGKNTIILSYSFCRYIGFKLIWRKQMNLKTVEVMTNLKQCKNCFNIKMYFMIIKNIA